MALRALSATRRLVAGAVAPTPGLSAVSAASTGGWGPVRRAVGRAGLTSTAPRLREGDAGGSGGKGNSGRGDGEKSSPGDGSGNGDSKEANESMMYYFSDGPFAEGESQAAKAEETFDHANGALADMTFEVPYFWRLENKNVVREEPLWRIETGLKRALTATHSAGEAAWLNSAAEVFKVVAGELYAGYTPRSKKRDARAREDLESVLEPRLVASIEEYVRLSRRRRRRAKDRVAERTVEGEELPASALVPARPYSITVNSTKILNGLVFLDASGDGEVGEYVWVPQAPFRINVLPKAHPMIENIGLGAQIGRFIASMDKDWVAVVHLRTQFDCTESFPTFPQIMDDVDDSNNEELQTVHTMTFEAEFEFSRSESKMKPTKNWRVVDIDGHFMEVTFSDSVEKFTEWAKKQEASADDY